MVLPPIIPLLQCFLSLSSSVSHPGALFFLSVCWNILLRPFCTYLSCQILLGCPPCHIMIPLWLRHFRVRTSRDAEGCQKMQEVRHLRHRILKQIFSVLLILETIDVRGEKKSSISFIFLWILRLYFKNKFNLSY